MRERRGRDEPRRTRIAAAAARSLRLVAAVAVVGALVSGRVPLVAQEVTVAAVQFEVDAATYASVEAFEELVAGLVAQAVEAHEAEIVVFPEYINVFLVASFYPRIATTAVSLEEALARVSSRLRTAVDAGALLRAHAVELEIGRAHV